MSVSLGYRYAEIGESQGRVYVYYYVTNPSTDKMERKRIYLNNIKSKQNKLRYARQLKEKINNKLDNGWNPFIDEDESSKKYKSIEEALDFVLTYKSKFIRPRSIPQYRHRINTLKEWLKNKKILNKMIHEFTQNMAIDFMNDLIINREITTRTFNNYLLDYRTFFNTLVKNQYLNSNPFQQVDKLPTTQTLKRPFTESELSLYMEHIQNHNYDLYIISLYTYCCGLRPAEICRLKIKDVNLKNGYIHIPGNASKNKKIGIIPIPGFFLEELKIYLAGIPEEHYICSTGLKPGAKTIKPNKIAQQFRKTANKIGLPGDLIFYSLKDTAADRLLQKGFSVKDIRDLFRHSNISTTDAYLKTRNIMINEKLITNFPNPNE
ncbi:MAG: tyrosine-type recombinase/integrase [bacterium]